MKWSDFYQKEAHPWGIKATHFVRENHQRLKGPEILDLGSGDGKNALYLSSKGFRVTAVDNDKKALATLQQQARQSHLAISTCECNIEDYLFARDYDSIVCTWVLHYLSKEKAYQLINRVKQHTMPQGVNLIIAFTNNGQLQNEDPSRFYLEPNELLELYRGWEILAYKKQMGGTIRGIAQEREMILAKKCG